MSAGVVLTARELADYRGDNLCVFLGVQTANSSIHRIFPAWEPLLAPDTRLVGLDLAEDTSPHRYEGIINDMAANPSVRAAVVTSHKLRLYQACVPGRGLLGSIDPLSSLTHEINCLDLTGPTSAFARDPLSLSSLLVDLEPERPIVCLGAGGAATALLVAATLDIPETLKRALPLPLRYQRPLTFLDTDEAALAALDQVRQRCKIGAQSTTFIHATTPRVATAIVTNAPAGSVVINATGLGKLSPGSPLEDDVRFPNGATAWDFNYRGPLTFLDQARRQGVRAVDGWHYFVAGWTAALCAVTERQYDPSLLKTAEFLAHRTRPRGDRDR